MDQFPGPAAAITQTFINTLQDAHLASPPPSLPSSPPSRYDFPPFYQSPHELITTSQFREFHAGNGQAILKLVCRELLTAKHEVLFVTGFWAKGPSRGHVNATLRELNRIAGLENRRVKVCIGFSSCSLTQKLFHTSSAKGRIWPPSTWAKKLGLPAKEAMPNIDMEVKSLFFRPVGLLHGKFAIVDRRRLLLPSANVGYGTLVECCGVYDGGIVGVFTRFWECVWGRDYVAPQIPSEGGNHDANALPASVETNDEGWPRYLTPAPRLKTATMVDNSPVPAIFLPHPHHASLPPVWPLASLPDFLYRFVAEFFAFLTSSRRPPTDEASYLSNPQNAFWVSAIDSARSSIYLHTPNITSAPLRAALLRALQRGVPVEILTSRNMMVIEQIVTAGTTTEHCMKKFMKAAEKLGPGAGTCYIYWFDPKMTAKDETGAFIPTSSRDLVKAKKSHVKCLIVDEEVVVLGSGNADRASWVTSQEVNVGVFPGKDGARAIRGALVEAIANRFIWEDSNGLYIDGARSNVLLHAEPRLRV